VRNQLDVLVRFGILSAADATPLRTVVANLIQSLSP
jgi:hypothetical protein